MFSEASKASRVHSLYISKNNCTGCIDELFSETMIVYLFIFEFV